MTRTYIIPMRAPSAPRTKHGSGRTYQPAEYREAQRELRRLVIEHYGHLETIEPVKPVKAAPSKGRAERPAYRNVRIDFEALLTGHSAVDIDNVEKWIWDSLGPLHERTATKADLEMGWVPLYRNDRQIAGGAHFILDHQPYNELRFTVTELEAALEPGAQKEQA